MRRAVQGMKASSSATDSLLDVALLLRDELGFNFLSSVTGVDLIDENKTGGRLPRLQHQQWRQAPLVFKVQVDRDNPLCLRLTPLWPGADFQEREAYDHVRYRI